MINKNVFNRFKCRFFGFAPVFIFIMWTAGFAACQATGPDAWENYQDSFQPGKKVLDAVGIKPGMTVGEIGAGRGRYAVKLAARVGRGGRVYANDISQTKLDYLQYRCKRDNISNIVTVQGKETRPMFPGKSLDVVFMINTYHHIEDPVALLKNTIPSLKSGGILAVVEAEPGKAGVRWDGHQTHKEVLLEQLRQAGYRLLRIETFLPKDDIYIFTVANHINVNPSF